MKKLVPFLTGAVLGWLFALGPCGGAAFCCASRHGAVRDTITTYDTIAVVHPVARDSVVVRYATVRVPCPALPGTKCRVTTPVTHVDSDKIAQCPILDADSVIFSRITAFETGNTEFCDSVEVQLPITQKHYADTLYEAWVSGYEPALDSIRVYAPVTSVREFGAAQHSKKRWGLGVSAGVGMTPKGVQPYIGIGIHYNI